MTATTDITPASVTARPPRRPVPQRRAVSRARSGAARALSGDERGQAARIVTWVSERISDGTYPPGLVLPTYGALAHIFGVAVHTVSNAIEDLAARDAVSRLSGDKAAIAGNAPSGQGRAMPLIRWVELELRRSITTGALPAGSLITHAEVGLRYRVSIGTLRRAARPLRDEGLLTSDRHGLHIPGIAPAASSPHQDRPDGASPGHSEPPVPPSPALTPAVGILL